MKSGASIRVLLRIVVAVAMILLGGAAANTAERIKVVATFSVIGDMVANVGGDRVELVTLVGPAGDTELFKPSLGDAKNVAEAKIVFMNDLNDEFEPWLEPLLRQVKFNGTKVVVSRGAKTYTSTEERAPRNKSAEEEIDQHAWLDPKNGVIYVRNISNALAKADPANAAEYRARTEAQRLAILGRTPEQIAARLQERARARSGKDFARADAIRKELEADGIEVADTPAGTTYRVGI